MCPRAPLRVRMRAARPLPLLLAMALGLAGCIETLQSAATDLAEEALVEGPAPFVAHRLDGVPLAEGVTTWLARGAQLSTGFDAYEPTLGVDKDGVLFMTGYAGGAPTTLRSTDGGLTWEDAGPRLPTGHPAHPFTADPYIYLDPVTGRVFQNDNLILACSELSWTDDKGETWTTNPVGCAVVAGPKDHQSMVAAKPRKLATVGYPHVVYQCTNTAATTECATSLNGGLTFGPAVTVFPTPDRAVQYVEDDCSGILSHPVADSQGRVYVAHNECGVPVVGVTEDDGLTWTTRVVSEDVKQYAHILMHDVSLAVDEADNLYAAWMAEDGLPVYAWSADQGQTWSAPRRLSPPHVTAAMLVDIEAGAPGRLAAAYVATEIEGGYGDKPTGGSGTVTDLSPAEEPAEWDDAAWHAYLTVIPDAMADDPVVLTVTANDPADPVARGVCGKTRCGGMGDFLDVRIAPDGRAYAAFVDVCTAECVTDPGVKKDEPVGFVGTLMEGPALRGDLRGLPPLVANATR